MAHRASRLLALLQALREHRAPVTATTLAARFAVSERTVYRDLSELAALGVPVEGQAGLGFVLRRGFFLPPLALDETEADAVMLGLRFVRRRGDAELGAAAHAAMAKIEAGLAEPAERAARGERLVVAPSAREGGRRLAAVRRALDRERKLRMAYRDGQGRPSRRTVWPLLVGFFDETEMLAAWCERREAFRHFRIDRIETLEPLAEPLPVPHRTLLARYRREEPDVAV